MNERMDEKTPEVMQDESFITFINVTISIHLLNVLYPVF